MTELDMDNYKQLLDFFGEIDKLPKDIEFVNKRQLDVAEEAEHRYKSIGLPEIYTKEDIIKAFRDGADWADKHPKNIWHDASEEPQGTYSVLCDGPDDMQWVVGYLYVDMAYANWKDYAESINVIRWAYISDILPKGGEL